ncbi:uncharacterized protein [Maniola hyperantus]|uniref:uncharacterized protein isoform X2 n=1 Tax=Aphantopus hyperantus TaxID=2795564 RepID=UPI003749B963
MEGNSSAWVLCPSKKLEGRYYYFNTRTAEKAWSWTMPSGKIPDGSRAEKSKQRPTPHETISEQPKQGQTPHETISEQPKQGQTPHETISEQPKQGPTPHETISEQPKQGQTPHETISEQPKQGQTPDERISEKPKQWQTPHETISEKPNQGQTPHERILEKPKQWQTPDERISEKPKQGQTPHERISEKPKQWQTPDERISEKPQAQTFSKVEFPRYLHNHAINKIKNGDLNNNLNKPNVLVNNLNLISQSRKSEHIQFKSILNNPFSLRLPKSLDSKQLCEGSPRKSVFEPIFDNNFLPKRRSSTDIEELSQCMKKAKICSPLSSISEQDGLKYNPDIVNIDLEFDDDTSSSTTRNRWHRNENVKVGINFLRNLSTSEYTNSWYLVLDVEVLLENLNFMKNFIAGDRTCSLHTPAVVLAKLKSLRDDPRAANDRAAIAGRVYLWLLENSVCETDNHLDCSLDNVTVHKQIIEYCKQANTFHLVIITKSKNLWDLARRNDIHVYYLNALKIINQKENLFLLDPDKETFKWPASPAVLNECYGKKSAYENFGIFVNQNGERSIFSRTSKEKENSNNLFEGNVKRNYVRTATKINFEGDFIESSLKEFCAEHENLQTNVYKSVDECTCSFLQIMEHCLHNVLQSIPEKQSDPPCWLHEGLQRLKEHYCQNKVLCAIVDRLISMCGFYISNDIMRPNIKSDRFIQILGAGILLIKELEKISQLPELSDCKQMLTDLIASIQTAEEFPDELSISSECRQRIGDEPFRMERDETAENSCDRVDSGTGRTPQHEVVTNTGPDYNIPLLRQNNRELFDVEGCCGSIKLFRNNMVDGNISTPNATDSNQDKTIQSTGSNQYKTIQSTGSNQFKSIQSTDSNQDRTIQLTGSNQDKTTQSTGANQYKTIKSPVIQYKTTQSAGSKQYKTNQSPVIQYKTIQSTGSNQYKTIQSTGSNLYKTIQSTGSSQDKIIKSIECNQNKLDAVVDILVNSNAVSNESGSSYIQSESILKNGISQTNDNGDPVFQKLENTVDMIRRSLTKMKHFIESVMEELNKGEIPERRKECLREKSDRYIDCVAGLFQSLKLIQKRENPSDPSFGKRECIEHCLEQVEYMHRAFSCVLEALK